MSAVTLLIVDDERLTREGLGAIIRKEKLSIGRICECEDGERALALCRSLKPDIILTDVRMPGMDGIALAKAVKQFLPHCCIIFMSGFSDKGYLLSAIEIGALRYIEKPIARELLVNLLADAVAMIREERERTLENERMRAHSQMGRHLLRQEYAMLLTEANGDTRRYAGLFPEFENARCYVAILMSCVRGHDRAESKQPQDQYPPPFPEAVEAYIDSRAIAYVSALKDGDVFLMHLAGGPEQSIAELRATVNETFSVEATQKLPYALRVAAGSIVTDLRWIPDSYADAAVTYQRLFFCQAEALLWFRPSNNESLPIRLEVDPKRQIEQLFMAQNEEGVLDLIREVAANLSAQRSVLPGNIKSLFYQLTIPLHRSNEKRFLIDAEYDVLDAIQRCQTLSELTEYVLDLYQKCFELTREREGDVSIVGKVRRFIDENYGDSRLNMQVISDGIHVSIAYMCTVFKRETADTINSYITLTRLGHAKTLLSDRSLRVSEVSGLVGYDDQNYFARTFKKNVGCTPTEFRERQG